MSFVVALALAGSVAIVSTVLHARAKTEVVQELTHESEKLRAYAGTALDPSTGQRYRDGDSLLTAYLRTNVPNPDETFFTVIDGEAAHRSPFPPPARLDLDPALVAWAAALSAPREQVLESAAGPVHVAAIPVRVEGDSRPAALVIAEFTIDKHKHARDATWVLVVVGTGALVLTTVANWFVAGRILAPIRLVRSTAQRISESDFSRRIEVTGDDDVAALARTFNSMLDRLETAFVGQRRFLHDVGHELRTPLTIIRGHLELMGDDPDDRRETLSLVVDEIDRMNGLVDDLTVLAQAEGPGFLRPGPINAAHLVIEVIAKARPLGHRRWLIDSVSDSEFMGDEHRLTQALMQLISNAVQHTESGQVIAVGSSARGDHMRLWVRDEGRGVPSTDADRIFVRHARGVTEAGRSGSGLGLAIVDSIARAHGGGVDLTSNGGRGATFTLNLPPWRANAESASSTPIREAGM